MRTVITCMVTLLVLGGGWSSCACATAMPDAQHDGQVTLTGEARESPRVTTSGTNMPLRNALRLVVPIDYSINLPNAGVWAATPVSWGAGHSLVQTLRDMLAGHPELAAQVDTDFQLVTVRYRQPFGTDTFGTLPPAWNSVTPSASASNSEAGGAAVVGGPLATNVSAAPLGDTAGAAAQPAAKAAHSPASRAGAQSATAARTDNSTASPTPAQPRITSKDFAAGVAGPSAGTGTATQADRYADAASSTAAAAHGSTSRAGTPSATAGGAVPALAATVPSASSASSASAVPPPPPLPTWRIELSDRTVRAALTRWAQQAGWQLIWEAPVDFSVDAPAVVTGTFDQALQSVVAALASSNAPVQAILYRGNKVLRIVEKGAG
ncbi:toxin co-regulated pilus biosynthesis Q family protein [Paraburkholderia sediminicola]|uniref:toxin co-regulated pilus biosynthesis Q family protein n=1 Tax=Paraburkholderia sediminicola TaxID=458836 RepID=UPI0038BBCDFE